MSTLLKALLKEAFDLVTIGEDAVAKNYTALLGAVLGAGEDVPPIVADWADLKPELQALIGNPAADADMLAYVGTLLGGSGTSSQVQAVISASASLVLTVGESGYALYQAIEAAKAA